MKRVFKVLLSILAVLLVIICAFFIYVNINTENIKDISHMETELKTLSPKVIGVDNIKLYTQPDAFTCGVTSQSVVASFLEKKDLPPQYLIEKYKLGSGMDYTKFVNVLGQELPDYNVSYQHNTNDFEMIKAIHEQLKNGIPVPVFFGAANPYNKPNFDFHASVVRGIDLDKEEVDILNVYGFEEKIPLVEFLNRMAYRGTENYPLIQKIVLRLGLQDKNSVVLISKK